MREKEIDISQNFEQQAALSSLVSETFESADATRTDDIYQQNGRLNISVLVRNAKILLAAGDIPLAKNIFRKDRKTHV